MTSRRTAHLLLGLLIGAGLIAPAFASDVEDELKLAFTYNIARFVTWPEHTDEEQTEAFHLCVLGKTPFRIANENLGRRRVADLPIEVIDLLGPPSKNLHCDLAYLSADAGDIGDVIELRLPETALTVSDAPGFANAGGIIELTRRNDRIAMRINVSNVRRAGLSISSQLLSLATLVGDESGAN
ncbi:MAG: YfiR family protein [Pseudomonadota bacterium]